MYLKLHQLFFLSTIFQLLHPLHAEDVSLPFPLVPACFTADNLHVHSGVGKALLHNCLEKLVMFY